MAQVYLDRNFSMHTGPSQMEQEALLAKMYPVPRGPWMYAGMGRLGISVADMVAACGGSGSQNCDPHDSSCVAVAQALTTWAENEQEANFPYGPSVMPPCPDLSDTQAITQAFMSNNPVSLGPQTGPGTSIPIPADTGTSFSIAQGYGPSTTAANAFIVGQSQQSDGSMLYAWSDGSVSTTTQHTGQTYASYQAQHTPPQPATIQTTTPPSTPLTPMSSGITNTGANLAQQNAGQQSNQTSTGGAASSTNWFTQSMISGIPNWVLLAAGGAALFLFAEKK